MASSFGGNPSQSLAYMLRTGASRADAAVSSGSSAVGAARSAAGAMRSDAAAMRDQARLVNTEAGKVGAEADALKALIPQLDPYKYKLTEYGDDLNSIALGLQTRANDAFGQAGALANLDPNAGGIAGEYIAQLGLLSPDRYASRYASDAQAAIDNARGQTERNLARRGVSIGSGAAAGLMNNLQRIKEAAVLAAARTLGRQKGIDERGNWLKELTSAANTFYGMGNQTESQALAAKGAAGDMAKGAAGIVAQQGDMTKDVGSMRAEVAQLYANAANIFGDAASVEGSAGKLTVDAYNALISAQRAAADYYVRAASTEVSANNGGGGGGGGGFTVSSSGSGDDWMNWKGTGHTASWNRNHNPNFNNLIANAE